MLLDPLEKGVRKKKEGERGIKREGEKGEEAKVREGNRDNESSAKRLSEILLSAHLLPTLTSNGGHVITSTANLHGLVIQHSWH